MNPKIAEIAFWFNMVGVLLNYFLMLVAANTSVLVAVVPLFAGNALLFAIGMVANYLITRSKTTKKP